MIKEATPEEPILNKSFRALDLRPLPHDERSLRLCEAFGSLHKHSSFILVSGEDLSILLGQCKNEFKNRFASEILEQEPEKWKAIVTKNA